MKKICVIAAMADELEVFLTSNQSEIKVLEEKPFKIYRYHNHLIALSGIGLINAGACAAYVAVNYKPTSFLNIGLAGASENADVKILEPIIVNEVYHGGVNATAFDYQYGQTPKEAPYFSSNESLIKDLNTIIPSQSAILASTDSFIASLAMFNEVIKPLPVKVDLMDMEAFGYYQIAAKFNIPIVALKIVSDIINKKGDNNLQFIEILSQGSQIIANVMVKYIK